MELGVQFNDPPNTIYKAILEAIFTASHLTDTDKQNSTGKIHNAPEPTRATTAKLQIQCNI